MSNFCEIDKEIIEQSKCLCECDNRVFTSCQTEKIIQIDNALLKPVIKCLRELKCKVSELCVPKCDDDLKKIQCQIAELVQYDESNTCVVNKIICDLRKLDERVGFALCSQAKELEKVVEEVDCLQKQIKMLQCKDEKLECLIKKCDSCASCDEVAKLLCRLEKLECCLKDLKCDDHKYDECCRRLSCVEGKKCEDNRCSDLAAQICKLEKKLCQVEAVNCEQAKSIQCLSSENVRQCEEIKCLSEKLNRNSAILDSKINDLEKEELCEKKLDACQSAQISVLQGQVCKLNEELERIQKCLLVKPHC